MFRMRRHNRVVVAMSGIWVAAMMACASAEASVIATYSNDFSTSVSDFTSSTGNGGWTLDTGAGTYWHTTTVAPAPYTSAVQVSNLGGSATSDFVLSGEYTASAGAGTSTYVGLAALANTASFGDNYYQVRQIMSSTSNQLQVRRFVGGVPTTLVQMTSERLSYNLNDLHELILVGTYVDSDSNGSKDALELTATLKNLTDGTTWTAATYTDLSPLTGQYFGLQDSNSNNNSEFTNAWTSFAINTVPEPTSAAMGLVTAGGLLMGAHRRDRRA